MNKGFDIRRPREPLGPDSPVQYLNPEYRDKEKPKMTLFLLRHGESSEDKSDPNRDLTPHGQEQVQASMQQILETLLKEENPDFQDWHDEEKKSEAITQAIKNVEFHLRDSGTYRTQHQVWLEYQSLKNYGVAEENIYLPQSVFEHEELVPSAEAEAKGPGIQKRLKGIQGLDPKWRMEVMRSKEYQQRVGASDEMEAWALTPEEEVPQGTESRQAMERRYQRDITKAERVVNKLTENYPKRVVTIANSHASIATLAAASELDIPVADLMKKITEMPEAQGLRYDFYGPGKNHETKPFGPDIEKAVAEMKE